MWWSAEVPTPTSANQLARNMLIECLPLVKPSKVGKPRSCKLETAISSLRMNKSVWHNIHEWDNQALGT